MFVFDATPLIYLAKVDRLDLLEHLSNDCLIPEAVYEEVITIGIEAGHPDARRVERAVDEGVPEIRSVENSDLVGRLGRNPNLSGADVAVIAMADARDGIAVMDERYGRTTAETEGVVTRGTAWIVLSLVREGHLSVEEARGVIDGMIDAGWYCSTDLYTRIVRKLESLG